MKKVYIRDKDLENYDIANLKLSILFSQDGLSYSLMSVSDNKYLCLISFNFDVNKDYIEEVETVLNNENLIGKKFAKSCFVVADRRQTIIPSVLFEKGTERIIWELNFLADENYDIKYVNLARSSNVVVFPINKNLQDLILTLIPNVEILPSSFSLIESNFTRNKLSEHNLNSKVFVHVFEEYVELLILDINGLKLFNTFPYKTSNDLLYLVINLFEQLKLSREDTHVVFSGFIETDNLAILNLRKFVSQVYFEAQSVDYKYFFKFQDIAPHYFYNFLNV